MTYDEMREAELINLSRAQRTNTMKNINRPTFDRPSHWTNKQWEDWLFSNENGYFDTNGFYQPIVSFVDLSSFILYDDEDEWLDASIDIGMY